MISHWMVMAGSTPVACFTTKDLADAFTAELSADGGLNVKTVQAVQGTPGDPVQTCDDWLLSKDAIIAETVALLNG